MMSRPLLQSSSSKDRVQSIDRVLRPKTQMQRQERMAEDTESGTAYIAPLTIRPVARRPIVDGPDLKVHTVQANPECNRQLQSVEACFFDVMGSPVTHQEQRFPCGTTTHLPVNETLARKCSTISKRTRASQIDELLLLLESENLGHIHGVRNQPFNRYIQKLFF